MNKTITIYELLGLVKDKKVPKNIKYEYVIWEYSLQENDYRKGKEDYWLFEDYFPNNLNFLDCLQDQVEILEDNKLIIEKLRIARNDITYDDGSMRDDELADSIIEIKDKMNEIIDYINRKTLIIKTR